MLKKRQPFCVSAAIAVATLATAPMASGATTSTLGGIRLNTAPPPAVIGTLADLDAFSKWRIGWGAGETVTVTAPNGTVTTLAGQAVEAGSSAFSLRASGSWTLSNSGGGTVSFQIVSAAFADVSSQPSGPFAMDTVGEGPNRTAKSGQNPPFAYTGDDWRGDAARTSTLTFTPPTGSPVAPTMRNLAGTGATPFRLGWPGEWTVRLAMADGTTLQAVINIDGNTLFFVR